MSPRHAQDVLIAFRMDVTKLRYENWDEVIHYCRYSAMPVGRFMLDVHGESHLDLGRVGCALRRLAGQQSPAGLRQGLQEPQPRLSSARRAGRIGRRRRDAGGGEIAGPAAAMPAGAGGADGKPAQRKQVPERRGEGFAAWGRDLRDPVFCRQDRSHAESARSLERAGASGAARTVRPKPRGHRQRDDAPRRGPAPVSKPAAGA